MNIATLHHNVLLFLCRIHETDCDIVKVIGRSLHNLEQLYLNHLVDDSCCSITSLVTGCPKLKILHLGIVVRVEFVSMFALEYVQYTLLGLPNLIEFRHPLVVFALEKIIQDGRADKVSSLRTLYIGDETYLEFRVTSVQGVRNNHGFVVTDVSKAANVVINHLINITKLTITLKSDPCTKILTNLSLTVPTMNHLTELTVKQFSYTNTIVLIIEAVGHQLRLLDLLGVGYFSLDVIDQCRELRVLRLADSAFGPHSRITDRIYGRDLQEEFTPFQYLQVLCLSTLNRSHLKPALLKSLIASPVLQDLKLVSVRIFTDHIVKAVVSHINQTGEQLAFTSLRKLELKNCHAITNYLKNVVTHERVPLEMLTIERCSGVTERHLWNLERFDLTFNDDEDPDD